MTSETSMLQTSGEHFNVYKLHKKSFTIYNNLNCQSKCLIFYIKCTAGKIRYVEKVETPFNTCLNNHQSDVSDPNDIPASCHFARSNHNFNTHAKFTPIKTIANKNKPTEFLQDTLIKRRKLCTLIVAP